MEKITSLNTYIIEMNKEIEIVKSHIQELIGIDISNLATFGDLSNLEVNLKHYTDTAVDSVDLSDYAKKDELPDLPDYVTKKYVDSNELDLSSCVSKTEMYYEGDSTKDIRIKYNTLSTSSFDHKNNIYIGGSYDGRTDASAYQNIVIGPGAKSKSYQGVIIGCDSQNNSNSVVIGHDSASTFNSVVVGSRSQAMSSSVAIGTECTNTTACATSVGYKAISIQGYTVALGYLAQTRGVYCIAVGTNAQATGNNAIAIGNNCVNSTQGLIKFWSGLNSTTSSLTGVQFGNIIFGISGSNLTTTNATSFDIRLTLACGISEPTNNNIVTKQYINSIPDLTNYLTADIVYIPPATSTSGFDVSGITGHNPDDYKLVMKKYVDDLFNSLQ
jgi:hypothetical protein